ncbi:MAG: FtsH protease activity modulator HflK [Gammaproteobacteria bacterium]|nr:MAG: FtsH protease activity modulator HflK [Gammaproteobacteria bacterium]
MAWNEPGGSGKDPWESGGRDQGPPDLDEMLRKLQNRFGGWFGGGGGPRRGLVFLGIIILLIIWGLSGIYIIAPAERGVVLRFGRFVSIADPGPHWHLPYPIERVEVVNVDQIRNVEVGYRSRGPTQPPVGVPKEALMLTQDENIVDVRLAVQYRVKSAPDYLFNVRDPDTTLRKVTESAVREIIGKSKMDFVLTEGRAEIAQRTEKLIQDIIDRYGTGLLVTSVNMQDAQPPEQVQAAFADVIKAREDKQRLINEAEAYANDILPKARGAAARQREEANAYKEQVVARAEGQTSRFLHVLEIYQKAPEVTRERLYLDTMETVFKDARKVLLNVAEGNNVLLLPLDKLTSLKGGDLAALPAPQKQVHGSSSPPFKDFRSRENLRSRRVR